MKEQLENMDKKIKEIYGYHDFSEQPYHWRLFRWLYNRFWYTNDQPSTLFELTIWPSGSICVMKCKVTCKS